MKILVVDDIVGWQNYHIEILKNMFPNADFYRASSARESYDKLIEHNDSPFDVIITDMQMEADFEPKYAGEWFVEQIKTFSQYAKTKVVIISAAYNIEHIAKINNVLYIRKSTARNFPEAYGILKE